MRRSQRVVMALVVALMLPLVPGTASAATPPLLNWGELVPGFTPGIDTSSANECTNGSHRCVESIIRKMNRDLRKLARTCDHNAIFQLGYTRTTEAYYESSQIPGFYDDVPWMHHYDSVFASYYTQPQQDWTKGNVSDVAPAWREAFSAADGQELPAVGNFLMGMNAHINRDLPFVIADIGLTDEDGNSRKPDHERVNEFLNNVADDMGPEIVARFDPTFDTNSSDDLLTGFTVAQVIQEWRERAWHNATLMTYGDPLTAELVRQGIERGSALLAAMIRDGMAYDDDADRDARNAHCAEHGQDYDGFDGTYFDDDEFSLVMLEMDEPDAPDVLGISTLPLPTLSLSALRLLGINVSVDIRYGVSVTLR